MRRRRRNLRRDVQPVLLGLLLGAFSTAVGECLLGLRCLSACVHALLSTRWWVTVGVRVHGSDFLFFKEKEMLSIPVLSRRGFACVCA